MECNKDEATRAKEIAEKKFIAQDIPGAKKFALKAQSLYPGIEGISQMLATLAVYVAAENKINGEVDWYGILGVNPQDDDETVKRKYRKLALMLHPDKNKSVGAEGAFKHVSEAWKFLSDKEKRAAYDRRRNARMVYQKFSASSANNGFCNFTKTTGPTTNVKTAKNSKPKLGRNANNGMPSVQKARQAGNCTTPNVSTAQRTSHSTFWTVCRQCMMQYEYARIYVNCHLLCPNCRQSYLAVEIPPPLPTQCSFSRHKDNLNQKTGTNNSSWTFSRTSCAVHVASVVQQAYEKVKKEREKAQAATRKDEALQRKNAKKTSYGSSPPSDTAKRRRIMEDIRVGSNGSKVTYQMNSENGGNTGKLYRSKHVGISESSEINKTAATANDMQDLLSS